jgi:hypothetical protein
VNVYGLKVLLVTSPTCMLESDHACNLGSSCSAKCMSHKPREPVTINLTLLPCTHNCIHAVGATCLVLGAAMDAACAWAALLFRIPSYASFNNPVKVRGHGLTASLSYGP